MPCKFSKGTVCFGNLIKLFSLPTEDAEIILSEHGFLISIVTLAFEICDGHLKQTREENKRRWAHNSKCCIPPSIAIHNSNKGNKFIGNRRITREILKRIHFSTGIVVPIGAPICTLCRKTLASGALVSVQNEKKDEKSKDLIQEEQFNDDDTSALVNETCASEQRTEELESITDYSSYGTDSQSQQLSQTSEASACSVGKLDTLNTFLSLSKISPVKEKRIPFQDSSQKTQSKCITKALQCIEAICDTICPGEGKLLEEKVKKLIYTHVQENEKVPLFDQTVLILKEVYLNSDTWIMQRQILSIIAKDRTYSEVKQLIPDISFWKFTKAKNHCSDVGCGMPLTSEKHTRSKMDEDKLEHFIDFIVSSDIVKDLPYGTKTMKLSNGQIVEVPNLIRSLAPSSLIEHYKQLCDTQDFTPLGTSTLYKILNECSASVRKCIEGLDYYVAEGGRSFQELEELIQKLTIDEDKKKSLTSHILSAKSYLKTDYKVHIKAESKTADHCRKYALGQSDNCSHSHTEICEQCENMEDVLSEISMIVHSSSWENKDSMIFQVDTASENIRNWKKHIVRSRNQEEAKFDLMEKLTDGMFLITSDWAMKLLPRKYREGQTDWFAKRGLNWHISVSVFRKDDAIKNITHVHIFSSQVSQDAATTVSLIKDTVDDLRSIHTDIKEIHFFSDNAGCYKNTLMMSTMKKDLGEKVASYNFSESQDGKGPCDRRASHIKAAIKRYINEGHNVTTAEEMKEAIDARQNGQFRVKVVDTITNVDTPGKPLKAIQDISQLFNFIFEKDGLRVYKAYKIGKGKLLPWNSIGTPPKSVELLVKMDWTDNSVGRSCNTSDDAICSAPKKKKTAEVFDCSKNGCTKTFNSSQALENHLLLGDCNYDQDFTSHDKAKSLYGSKVNDLFSNSTAVTLPSNVKEGQSILLQGWALKSKKKRGTFSDKQRNYIKEKFYAGKITGSKTDPYRAATDMRNLKVGDQFAFSKDEYLTAQQISSYFSRLALKDRNLELEDYKPAEEERCKEELKRDILKQMK